MKKKSKGGEGIGTREQWREISHFIFFSLCLFLRSTKIGPQFSSGLKAKLINATRAMRGHKNLGVSSNSTR